MFYNKFDSYYYSRPVSYRSYNPRLVKPEILKETDPDTIALLNFFKRLNINVDDLGGISRGIRFGDLEVGKRIYNHNNSAYYASGQYYIHQWKQTNDLSKEHPTGRHFITKSFDNLLKELERVVQDQRKTYK